MKITTLKESPQFFEKTLNLIEKSFDYDESNSFEIDFFPLINESNHQHCHLLIENKTVVAHIGALERVFMIESKKYPFTMFGGIAVNEDFRGLGKFKELFDHVLSLYRENCFYLLWSEKMDLYQKFGFHPCIELNQYPLINNNESYPQLYDIHQSYLIDLSAEDLAKVKSLYANHKELRVFRNENTWNELKEITSSEVYLIYSNDKLINYFIKNKGRDLTDIIHEYGFINKEQLELMQNFGHVWSPQVLPDNTSLFASLMKVGNPKLFMNFIENYTPLKIIHIGPDVEIEFKGEVFKQTLEEFLQGVFGPGRFEEISAPPIFISGLDSI